MCILCPQVKRFQAHKGPVNDLCFDETAEFVGSCSDDGGAMVNCSHHAASHIPLWLFTVPCTTLLVRAGEQVHSLYTDEVSKFKYSRPVKVGHMLMSR